MGLNCYAVHTMLRGLKFHRDWRTRYLLVRPEQWQLEHETNFWFRMYEVLDRVDAEWALDDIAADDGGMKLLREIREGIFPYFYTVHPPPGSYEEHQEDQRRVQDLKDALGRSFREHGELPTFAQFYVCQRKTPPGPPAEDAIKPPKPVGPARTETEHYVVIQALTHDKNPVQGVRLELVLAGGEIRSAVTDQAGFARVERIRAERVIIRVTSIDGGFWKALDGGASQPSSQDSDFSWHKVAPGECLSRIAHQHGIKSWKRVWEHPKNEPLRKKRKSPHVLSPGTWWLCPG